MRKRIPVVSTSYLLSHEVQSALQGVGDFDLPVTVVDLNASRAEVKMRKEIEKSQTNLAPFDLRFECDAAYTSGEMKLSWSMRTSRLLFTAALYMGIFLWIEA